MKSSVPREAILPAVIKDLVYSRTGLGHLWAAPWEAEGSSAGSIYSLALRLLSGCSIKDISYTFLERKNVKVAFFLKCDFVLYNAIEWKFFLSHLFIALKELFFFAIESPLQFDKMLWHIFKLHSIWVQYQTRYLPVSIMEYPASMNPVGIYFYLYSHMSIFI